ncbi:unnamed protein product [Closterium sp. NIES-54]
MTGGCPVCSSSSIGAELIPAQLRQTSHPTYSEGRWVGEARGEQGRWLLFLRIDPSLPLLYILVYIDDLVFATAKTEALALVKAELQKRLTCTDLDFDAILAAMYALADITEGDCYLRVPPDPGTVAAALRASVSTAPGASAAAALGASTSAAPGAGTSPLSGTAPTESLHTFRCHGPSPPCASILLFLRIDPSLPLLYILVYIDDLVFATAKTEALALVKAELQKRLTCTDLAPPSDESVEPCGQYPELVGCLMYLITCTRPDLTYPLSILVHYVAPRRHGPEHYRAATRVQRYLCSTSGMGLVLGGWGPIELIGYSDAALADDQATHLSSDYYTFSLSTGSVSWRSTRSSSVLSSSYEAEIYAGAMAAQELRWLTYLLTDLGEQPPPILYVDNKAMSDLCWEKRLEHKTKHTALRYFLARELQQLGQLRLAYVGSQANTADDHQRALGLVITKALGSCDHQHALGLVPTVPHLLVS